jgi:two-component system, sensor histidine kinase and response regulator
MAVPRCSSSPLPARVRAHGRHSSVVWAIVLLSLVAAAAPPTSAAPSGAGRGADTPVGPASDERTVTTAQSVRSLTATDAATGRPVRITGGVTHVDHQLVEVAGVVQSATRTPASRQGTLRSPADAVVLEGPWSSTGRQVLTAVAALSIVGLVVVAWAVTLRRQVRLQTAMIERRLQQEIELQARYRELFENATDVVCTYDLHGHITAINRAGERLTGYLRTEALGMRVIDLVAPEHRDRFDKALAQSAVTRQGATFDVDLVTRAGARASLEFGTWIIEDAGCPVAVQAIARDVSARNHAVAELQRARDAAEAASRAKTEFLATMSHEVRTPINGIVGVTELLQQSGLGDEQRQYLGMVRASTDALMSVINDVLDFSKIEAGHMDVRQEPFEPRERLAETLQGLGLAARQKGLSLSLTVEAGVPQWVVADPGRVRQVLLNLAGNAIKFTPCGAVDVSVGMRQQDGHAGTVLVIAVRDTGIGIPADKHDVVFDAFTQADGSIGRRYGGTGLGLAISSSLVRLMGGTIDLVSQPGKGSTFTVTIPVGTHAAEQAAFRVGEAFTALVLVPHRASRLSLAGRLAAYGVEPLVAGDVPEAAHALGSGAPPRLVVVDIGDAALDLAATARLLATSAGSASVVATAVAPQQMDRERAHALGASTCLLAPLRESDLASIVAGAAGVAAPATRLPWPAGPERLPLRAAADILLVEDNLVNQRVAERMLAGRGYRVRTAGNGREALELLAGDWRPHVVVMDVQMPEMDGLDATRAIRSREEAEGGHLPVIAMTAHAMEGDRERCLAAGMDDYVTKPVSAAVLLAAVERLLDISAAPALPLARPDPVDETKAFARVEGDADLLAEIIGLFLEGVPPLLQEIRQAAGDGESAHLMRTAHRLKGSLATLAAMPAADAALRLETIGRSGDLAHLRQALGALDEEMGRLLPALEALRSRVQRPAA